MGSIRSMLESLPLPCGASDRRGRVVWVNAAAARLAGSTPAKLVGADIRSLWPPAPVPQPRATETKVEHAVIGGRSVWLRVTRLPVGRLVVAVSEELSDGVAYGVTRGLLDALIADPIAIAMRLGIPLTGAVQPVAPKR